jgi:hypothetical protein
MLPIRLLEIAMVIDDGAIEKSGGSALTVRLTTCDVDCAKLPSVLMYCAEIGCVPALSPLTVMDAMPFELRFSPRSGSDPSLKSATPVGIPAALRTVAVIVTVWAGVAGFGLTVNVTVVGASCTLELTVGEVDSA